MNRLTLPFNATPTSQETELGRQLSIDLDTLLTVENVGVYAKNVLFSQIQPEQCSPLTAMALEHLQTAFALAHSMIETDLKQLEARVSQPPIQEKQAS